MDLDQVSIYSKLVKLSQKNINLKELLNPQRIKESLISNGPLTYSFAASLVDKEILDALQKLSIEQKVIEKHKDLLAGKIMNPTENRKVLHHQTRSKSDRGFYGREQEKLKLFADQVHAGKITGLTNKPFTHLVQIGIGGSDLGPRALYLALKRYVKEKKGELFLEADFISNVDPDDANEILNKIDPETTLFIIVSKSGTTIETLTNQEFARQKLLKAGINEQDLSKHFIAITAKGSPMDDTSKYLASFYIDDYIGGRYSSTSAVGGALLSLALGPDIFEEVLKGASKLDEAAKEDNIFNNMSLMSALIAIWERNFLGMPQKAIIPYAQALERFTAHLQQLDCESNGKSVNINGKPVNYETGPVVFGEPGTNSQHSFFQKLHQGTDVIPIQFIGFKDAQISSDLDFEGSTSQEKLNANLVAQIIALAEGKDDPDQNKFFSGNRPTSLVSASRLTPEVLGALLAFYENTVMFQGFLWNINSFDQEGVQLGKLLAKQVLSASAGLNLKSYLDVLSE
ncbi:glucose-6-phosphate isomerase [Candidatus Margulisiibacteriota bacterium]